MKATAISSRPAAKQTSRQVGTGLPSRERVSARNPYALATRVSAATWRGSKADPPTCARGITHAS
jgi:hypothetical protein